MSLSGHLYLEAQTSSASTGDINFDYLVKVLSDFSICIVTIFVLQVIRNLW